MYLVRDNWPIWGREFADWLDGRFSASVLSRFHSDIEEDWLDRLDGQQSGIDGQYSVSSDHFETVLRDQYRGVTVFHATRLSSLGNVRQHGLRAWSPQELRELAQAEFGGSTDAEVLRSAIEQNLPDHRGGRVYSFASLSHSLSLQYGQDEGELPSFAVAGGEFLRGVAACGGNWGDRTGHPPGHAYFLACNLPWDHLEPETVKSLSESVLKTTITYRYFDTHVYNMLGNHVCVSVQRDIPPEYIERVADVEGLVGRKDLTHADIVWMPFHE